MVKKIFNIYNKISFGNKLFLVNASVIIVALFILAYFANRVSTNAIIEKAEKSSVRELQLIDKNLKTMTDSVEDYSRVISSDFRLQQLLLNKYEENEEGTVDSSLEKLKIKSIMSTIMSNIISPNTQIIASAVLIQEQTIYSGYRLSNFNVYHTLGEQFIKKAVKKQTPIWSNLLTIHFDNGQKKNVFAVAKLVIDKDTGDKTGMTTLFVDEEKISQLYIENKSNESDRFYILNTNNIVISSDNKSHLYATAEDVLNMSNSELQRLKSEGNIIIVQNNNKYLCSLQKFEDLDWMVVSIVLLDEITKENREITKILVIVSIFCIIFSFSVSYLISYRVIRPIQNLTHVMKKIMDGNITIRTKSHPSGEIGILTRGFNRLMDRVETLIDEVYTEQKLKRKNEFKLIQSQIKPHFLYNTLETIKSFITLGMYENAEKTINNLSKFYRISLSKGNDVITIDNEIRLIKSYLNIQKFRYIEYMDFDIHIDDKILAYSIPKLTLQPIVENSIYHGLKTKDEKGKLLITGYISQGNVIIEIFDDGMGMSQQRINEVLENTNEEISNDVFGISSVDKRLKLLFGNEYGLTIESKIRQFTKVIICLPPVIK